MDKILEKEIKIALIKHLYKKNKNATIVTEVSLTTKSSHFLINKNFARADVFLINDEIVIYEIKSASDNLSRLNHQISEYLKYANRVFVVVDEKFIKKLKLPKQVGIYALRGLELKKIKDAAFSKILDDYYINYWWGIEFKKAFSGFGFTNLTKAKSDIKKYFSSKEIQNLTLARLKERYKDESEFIKNAIQKQEFNKLFPKRNIIETMKVTCLARKKRGKIEILLNYNNADKDKKLGFFKRLINFIKA